MLKAVDGPQGRAWCSPTATTRRASRGCGDVLDDAREKETMIYAIGLESEFFNRRAGCSARIPTAGCGSCRTKPAAATSS